MLSSRFGCATHIMFSTSIVKRKHIKTKRHIENFMYDFFPLFPGVFYGFGCTTEYNAIAHTE